MKYILLVTLILIISLLPKAQNMSIFLKATKSGWYPEFLSPVVKTITDNAEYKSILDIGTGPGTLPEMLIQKDSSLRIVGIDIDTAMVLEAKRRTLHKNVSFQYQRINAPLEFAKEEFDVVSFCSVLFLIDDSTKIALMNEAVKVLKPKGKILILTPSGKKSILSSFIEVWRYKFSFNNFTFPIWKIATTNRARQWQTDKWLEKYVSNNDLNYMCSLTFNRNATIEIISKK